YTVDTFRALRAELSGQDEIYFILGSDALADLPHWREPEELLRLSTLAVLPRLGEGKGLVESVPGARIVDIEMPYIGISSPLIRERVRAGLSVRYLVPDEVAAYIERHGLYRGAS